ncbi:hypothetical protein AMC79_CH00777 [Rhizobium phaseoli]|nr:hypothetical protein AMC89_CH00779 [Rhizobium phaseoli]ANL96612.1 hypothetical protein AMC79_CH00777 [Rhizobium phaseoli]
MPRRQFCTETLWVVIDDACLRSDVPMESSADAAARRVSSRSNKTGAERPPNRRSIDRADHFIVGMTNSAPLLMPEGQRAVTVLVLVQNLIESVPCWLRSPKLDAFQPPKEW